MSTEKPRRRFTVHTERRLKNTRNLITHMASLHEMPLYEIHEFLGFSPSGVRKYVMDMLASKTIVLVRLIDNDIRQPIYKLGEQSAIDVYLQSLTKPAEAPEYKAPAGARVESLGAGRNVHIMHDDTFHAVKLSVWKIPAPDPVLAHFFGRAQVAE